MTETKKQDSVLLTLPPLVPHTNGNRFTRWLGRTIFRLGGWRMEGEFPNTAKLVLIGAPHSSNWDGFWAFAAKAGMGLDIRLLGKDALFKVPVLGGLLRSMGMMPVDRSNPAGVVEQAAELIKAHDRFWYGLAPEGTRKPVKNWKQGFWRIAKLAEVDVIPAYFNYDKKILGIGPVFKLTDDIDADLQRIKVWFDAVSFGRHHNIFVDDKA